MIIPDDLLTVYSASIEARGGDFVVTIPERELTLGPLEGGESYRVAILRQPDHPESPDTYPAPTRNQETSDSGPPVSTGETRGVEIEDVGEQGDGIARIGPGYVVFVPDTAVGDRVTIEITDVRETFAFATVTDRHAN